MTRPDFPPGVHDRRAIGLDVGGTKIAGGVVTAGGEVVAYRELPTPAGGADTIDAVLRLIGELRAEHPSVEAIGVGAAGMIEWPSGYIRYAPNNAYRELPLKDLLVERTGLPSVVENDANAAAWAEARFGEGRHLTEIVAITVGTGIGGGLILGGRLYRGHCGIGAEIGHMVVNARDGALCGCGVTGCLEAEASGTALGRLGGEAARLDPAGAIATLAGTPAQVTGETVFLAAAQGDQVARDLFERLGFWLGVGLASLVTILDPEVVVVSGGLVATGDLLLAPTRASFERHVFAGARRKLPEIVPARAGQQAGLVGAAALALDEAPRH